VADFGLLFYNARWYDPALGRWTQPDTIVANPYNPVDYDRYAYVGNNPVRYVDPTGHWYYDPGCDCLVDTKEPGNERPENLNYQPLSTADFELPGPIPEQYATGLTPLEQYLARWSYAVYWSNPDVFTYNQFIWEWAWTYWELSASSYNLQQPWFTPAGQTPFIVATFGLIGANAQPNRFVGGSLPGKIGHNATKQFGDASKWEVFQIRMPGGRRIYDGRIPGTSYYLEIKTSLRGTVYPNSHIIRQLAVDMDNEVLWIFVNSQPSSSLVKLLEAAGIPWMTWWK
jgi:RHS repeat-associated protein